MDPKLTLLDPQYRGDPFEYTSSLRGSVVVNGVAALATQSVFTAGFAFTLRKGILVSSTPPDDSDSGVVDQATSQAGEITFSTTTAFRIFLPSTRTTLWPLGRLVWDFVGTIDDDHSYTIASGTITIVGDVKRAP